MLNDKSTSQSNDRLEEHSMTRSGGLQASSTSGLSWTYLQRNADNSGYFQLAVCVISTAATELECGQKQCMCLNAGSATQTQLS